MTKNAEEKITPKSKHPKKTPQRHKRHPNLLQLSTKTTITVLSALIIAVKSFKKELTTINLESGSKDRINVNLRKDFKIPDPELFPVIDSKSEEFRYYMTTNYKYGDVKDTNCQFIGTVYRDDSRDIQYQRCGKTIAEIVFSSEGNKFYQIKDHAETRYFDIQLPSKEHEQALSCDSVINLRNTTNPNIITEPVFLCKYEFLNKKTNHIESKIGFLTKSRPGNFFETGNLEQQRVMKLHVCPYLNPDGISYTNWLVATYEMKSLQRAQSSKKPSKKDFPQVYFYNYESKSFNLLNFKKINLDSRTLNSVGGLCIKNLTQTFLPQPQYFFVLQSIAAKNFNFHGFNHLTLFSNFSIFTSKSQTIDFDDMTKKLRKPDTETFIKIIKGVPLNNEVLVISKMPNSIDYHSCLMNTLIERNEATEPFQNCLRVISVPTDYGMFAKEDLEFGRAVVQGERGAVISLWRLTKQSMHLTISEVCYSIAEIFMLKPIDKTRQQVTDVNQPSRDYIWKLQDRLVTNYSTIMNRYSRVQGNSYLMSSSLHEFVVDHRPQLVYLYLESRYLMRTINEDSSTPIKIGLNSLGLYGPSKDGPSITLTINRSPGQIYDKIEKNREKIAKFEVDLFADYYYVIHDLDAGVRGNDITFKFLDQDKENAERREGYSFLVEKYDFSKFNIDFENWYPTGDYLVAMAQTTLNLYKCIRYRKGSSSQVNITLTDNTEKEVTRETLKPLVDCGVLKNNKPVPIKSLAFISGGADISKEDQLNPFKDQPIGYGKFLVFEIKNFKMSIIILARIENTNAIQLIRIDKARLIETNFKINYIDDKTIKVYEHYEYLVVSGINFHTNKLQIFRTKQAYNIATLELIFESEITYKGERRAQECSFIGFNTKDCFELRFVTYCDNVANPPFLLTLAKLGIYTFFSSQPNPISKVFNRYKIQGLPARDFEYVCILDEWIYGIIDDTNGPLYIHNVEESSVYEMNFKEELIFTKIEKMYCLDNFVVLFGDEKSKRKRILVLRRGGDKYSINTRVLVSHIFERATTIINLVTESREAIYVIYQPQLGLEQQVLFINTFGPQFHAKFNSKGLKTGTIGVKPVDKDAADPLIKGVETTQQIGIFMKSLKKTDVTMNFKIKEQNNVLTKTERFKQEGKVRSRKNFNQELQILADDYIIKGPLYEAFISTVSKYGEDQKSRSDLTQQVSKEIVFKERITRADDLNLTDSRFSLIKKIGIQWIKQNGEYLVIITHQDATTLFNILHRNGTFVAGLTINKFCKEVNLRRFKEVPGGPNPPHGIFLIGTACIEKGVYYLYFIQTLNSTADTLYGRKFRMTHPVQKFVAILSYPGHNHRGVLKFAASYQTTREMQIDIHEYALKDLMQVVQQKGKVITNYDQITGDIFKEVVMFDFVLDIDQKDIVFIYHDEDTKKISARMLKQQDSQNEIKEYTVNDVKDDGLKFKGFFCKAANRKVKEASQKPIIICAFLTTDHRIGYRMISDNSRYNFVQFGQRFHDLTFEHIGLNGDYIIAHSKSFTKPTRCILIYKINSTVPESGDNRNSEPLYLHAAVRDLEHDKVPIQDGRYTLSPANAVQLTNNQGVHASTGGSGSSARVIREDDQNKPKGVPNERELAFIYLIEIDKIRVYNLSQMSIQFTTKDYEFIKKYSIYSYGFGKVLKEWPLKDMFMEKDKITLKWVVILLVVLAVGMLIAWVYHLRNSEGDLYEKRYRLELSYEDDVSNRATQAGTGTGSAGMSLEMNQLKSEVSGGGNGLVKSFN